MSDPTGPWVYGLGEIADLVRIDRNLVYQWHRRGKLPPPDAMLRVGPVWRASTIHRWAGLG